MRFLNHIKNISTLCFNTLTKRTGGLRLLTETQQRRAEVPEGLESTVQISHTATLYRAVSLEYATWLCNQTSHKFQFSENEATTGRGWLGLNHYNSSSSVLTFWNRSQPDWWWICCHLPRFFSSLPWGMEGKDYSGTKLNYRWLCRNKTSNAECLREQPRHCSKFFVGVNILTLHKSL